MKEASVEEIENKVDDCIKNTKKWHFHILTPSCKFNELQKYALFFENPTNNEVLVSYSEEPEVEVGKELAKKLHGDKVLDEQSETQEPSLGVRKILDRIKELNADGKAWHHHMFFPDCIFNTNRGKWTIILEDPDRGQLLEVVSDKEPKDDLKHIEILFYQQKRVK